MQDLMTAKAVTPFQASKADPKLSLYHLLDPAARLIEGKHPLAATLLRRAMVEDTPITVEDVIWTFDTLKAKGLPKAPGVYLMKDDKGRVIYVGKAKSLRSRLNMPPLSLRGGRAGMSPAADSRIQP